MKDSKKMFKGFGFIGLGLCAVCCALPFSGIALWVVGFGVFSQYFESRPSQPYFLPLFFLAARISEKRKQRLHAILIVRAKHTKVL